MNRIETKIIIMVTNKLAAAKDSEAKNELIEEMSENLYQRYLDLTAEGMGEEDALVQVMDSLGDVKELLQYLKEENAEQGGNEEKKWKAGADLGKAVENIVQTAMEKAAESFDKIVWDKEPPVVNEERYEKAWEKEHEQEIRDMERQMEAMILSEMQPEIDKMMSQDAVDRNFIPAECSGLENINTADIHTIKVELYKGDIEVSVVDSLNLIDICTESDDLEISEPDNGILMIRQKKAKGTSFFSRMMEKTIQVEIGLPAKFWELIELKSPNGDIQVNPNLHCRNLNLNTTNGDMEVWNAQAESVRLQTVNGDITAEVNSHSLYANSVSGDVEMNNCRCHTTEIHTVSGDATGHLFCEESVNVSSTSGDVELHLGGMAKVVKVSTVSGDCNLQVPKEQGFVLQYKTASGNFSSGNMRFGGSMNGKSGNLIYQDGKSGEVNMSSVSGDMEIYV